MMDTIEKACDELINAYIIDCCSSLTVAGSGIQHRTYPPKMRFLRRS